MRYNCLIPLAFALAPIAGCDKSDDPANIVTQGKSAVQDARSAVESANGQTADPATLSHKLQQAEDLIKVGQIPAARTLLDQIEPKKDVLPDDQKTRLEEARKQVSAR